MAPAPRVFFHVQLERPHWARARARSTTALDRAELAAELRRPDTLEGQVLAQGHQKPPR